MTASRPALTPAQVRAYYRGPAGRAASSTVAQAITAYRNGEITADQYRAVMRASRNADSVAHQTALFAAAAKDAR